MMNKGFLYAFALAGTIILLFLANLAWGSVSIPWREVMAILSGNSADSSSETFRYIVLESRLPQAITHCFRVQPSLRADSFSRRRSVIPWRVLTSSASAAEPVWQLP